MQRYMMVSFLNYDEPDGPAPDAEAREDAGGEWVRYADAKAEIECWRGTAKSAYKEGYEEAKAAARSEIARLTAEVERLREHNDRMQMMLRYIQGSSMGSRQIKDYIRVTIPPTPSADRPA